MSITQISPLSPARAIAAKATGAAPANNQAAQAPGLGSDTRVTRATSPAPVRRWRDAPKAERLAYNKAHPWESYPASTGIVAGAGFVVFAGPTMLGLVNPALIAGPWGLAVAAAAFAGVGLAALGFGLAVYHAQPWIDEHLMP